jgi:hypothetical protein
MGKKAECQTLSGVVPPEFRSLWDGRGVPPFCSEEGNQAAAKLTFDFGKKLKSGNKKGKEKWQTRKW